MCYVARATILVVLFLEATSLNDYGIELLHEKDNETAVTVQYSLYSLG